MGVTDALLACGLAGGLTDHNGTSASPGAGTGVLVSAVARSVTEIKGDQVLVQFGD